MAEQTIITISLPPTAEQVAALREAGPGAVVHHPRASSPAARLDIARALRIAGLEDKLVRSLGYSERGPAPAPRVVLGNKLVGLLAQHYEASDVEIDLGELPSD